MWYDEETKLNDVEVKQFETLCTDLYEQKSKVDDIKSEEKNQNAVLTQMKFKILECLEQFGKTEYATNHGTIYVQEKFSVKVPKDPEEKALFFKWLEEKGIKDEITTVHSATLNSLYNEELKASGDPEFKIPGIDEPTSYKQLQIRSK